MNGKRWNFINAFNNLFLKQKKKFRPEHKQTTELPERIMERFFITLIIFRNDR
jgi:hypothetical protein